MALFNCNLAGGADDLLAVREYVMLDATAGTKGTYTSGTGINDNSSYPHAFLVNVKGLSGTFKAARTGSGGNTIVVGIKNGTVTTLGTGTTSVTEQFSDLDYIMCTGAAGGAVVTTYTITEA